MKRNEQQNSQSIRLVTFIISAINFAATIISLLTTDTELLFHRLKIIFQFAGNYSQVWPPYLILSTLLLAISLYELRAKKIPHSLTIPGSIIAITLAVMFHHVPVLTAITGLLTGLVCFGLLFYISKGKSLGFGVVMMEGMLGAFLGPINLLFVNIIAFALTILYVVYHRVQYKTILREIEFGPILAIATGILLLIPMIGILFGQIK